MWKIIIATLRMHKMIIDSAESTSGGFNFHENGKSLLGLLEPEVISLEGPRYSLRHIIPPTLL